VSLVPSLTEAVAVTAPGLLVGATDWCSHPPELSVARVRGTKNPRVEQVLDLRPDVVLANEEENRSADLDALRTGGLPVWTTAPRTVPAALVGLRRMLVDVCRLPNPRWLTQAEHAWDQLPSPQRRRRVVVPIWRRPWMALGRDTFAGDVLARLGYDNVLDDAAERYPRFDPATLPAVELVVLPDEPYRFTAADGPEAFPAVPAALVSGRHLTWYGPSLVEAPGRLLAELRGADQE
jgi:ABC-type hemin transport system substrate-binding protein